MQDNIDSFSSNIMSILNGLWPIGEKSIGKHGLYDTITIKYMPDNTGQEKSVTLYFEQNNVEYVRSSELINGLSYQDNEIRRNIKVMQICIRKNDVYEFYKNYDPDSLNGYDHGTYEYEIKQMFKELDHSKDAHIDQRID